MKKLLIVSLIFAITFILCACGDTITDEHGNKHYTYGRFVEIEETVYMDKHDNRTWQCIMYDKETKVVYVRERSIYGLSMSPYYTSNNGVTEVAIYGINYK